MAIDPRAAAAAAQAAAEAARAAAEAAAAAEARAAAAASEPDGASPALATSSTRQVLRDTDVAMGAELGGDAAGLAGLGLEESPIAAQERAGFAELPGLSSAIGGVGGANLPTLEGSFSSGGGDIGKSAIAEYGPLDLAVDIAQHAYRDLKRVVVDWADENFDGPAPDTTVDGGTPDLDEASGGEAGKSDPDLDAGSPEANEAAAEDEANSSGGTSGADVGGGTTDVPAEDAPFNPPPGWIDLDDLDFIPDERKIGGAIRGALGGDPDAGDDDSTTPGPQGGDTTVNPGAENWSSTTDRRTSVEPVRAVDWVGQPTEDDEVKLPAELQAIQPGPGPEVINPGSGDESNADAEVMASTAYTPPPDESIVADDGAIAVDQGPARGRDYGHDQGRGHGNDGEHGQANAGSNAEEEL